MKKSKKSRVMAGVLTVGVALSTMLAPMASAAVFEGSRLTDSNVQSILNNLTYEQKRAIEELSASPTFTIAPNVNTNSAEPVQVIVEFTAIPAAIAHLYPGVQTFSTVNDPEKAVQENHQVFHEFLEGYAESGKLSKSAKSDVTTSITHEYKTVFNGVAMTLPGTMIPELLNSGVVKRVWKDAEVQLSLPQGAVQPKMADSLPFIGVDRLHSENITGQGIKVGVIDTGIDYNHPDLNDAYKGYRAKDGENSANIKPDDVLGWDFVNDDADPMETTYSDWRKSGYPEMNGSSQYYTSHGTHVSGTIAGQASASVDYAVKGVAPDVEIYAYKVLGPYGGGSNSDVIAGIDKSVKDGMDIINLSLGSTANDPLDATSIAANNAMLAGVVTVIAAGNTGPNEGTLGSPGASPLAITVGASDVSIKIPSYSVTADVYGTVPGNFVDSEVASAKSAAGDMAPTSDEEIRPEEETASVTVTEDVYGNNHIPLSDIQLLSKNFTDDLTALEGRTLEVVYAGLGSNKEFTGLNVAGKIALIERGTYTFDEKIINAKNAGAAAVIIYNNVEGIIESYLGEGSNYIPAFQMLKSEGEQLKSATSASLTFTSYKEIATEGDALADFSSRGPTASSEDIKPDLVGPGVSVFSTYPEYMNDPGDGVNYDTAYARLSGTSMATPHIAGVAALIMQAHPDYDSFDIKTALQNTSNDLKEEYSVYEVGAGRVDAYQAVHSSVSVTVMDKTSTIENGQTVEIDERTGSLMFGGIYATNETGYDSRELKLENRGDKEINYELQVEFKSDSSAEQNGVQLSVPGTVSIAPGSTQNITAQLSVETRALNKRYEGYIHLVNAHDDTDRLQIPFALRVAKVGVDYIDLLNPAITNTTPFHQYLSRGVNGVLKLGSPMETIDAILKDTKSGETIGYLGAYNAKKMIPNKEYLLIYTFRGYMYPFTDNTDQPISDVPVYVPEGEYQIEYIAKDVEGNSFNVSKYVLVDNTPAQVTTEEIETGVIEVNESMLSTEDEHKALWVHGNINDESISLLNQNGYHFTQATNEIQYYENNSPFISGWLIIDDAGDFKFGVLPEEFENGYKLRLNPVDLATTASMLGGPNYVFVKEGTEYVTFDYDRDSVRLGEQVTMTSHMNNVSGFTGASFELQIPMPNFEFSGVSVNSEFEQLAQNNGYSVELGEPVVNDGMVRVEVKLSGEGSGLDGDFKVLDIKGEFVNDTIYVGRFAFALGETIYFKGTEQKVIAGHSIGSFEMISTHSVIGGYITPEAFMVDGNLSQINFDYSKFGSSVYVETHAGERYDSPVQKSAAYRVEGIPASDEILTLVTKTPGHLSTKARTSVGIEVDGEMRGRYTSISARLSKAGDVNGDEMIDIIDVDAAAAQYGQAGTADINQDDIVDEKDIRLIEKNFMSLGDFAGSKAKLQSELNGKGIHAYLKELEIEPIYPEPTPEPEPEPNPGPDPNPTPDPTPDPSPSPPPSPSTTNHQVITEDQLEKAENGKVTIKGEVGKLIELPLNAPEIIGVNNLEIVISDQAVIAIDAKQLSKITTDHKITNGKLMISISDSSIKPSKTEAGLVFTDAKNSIEVDLYAVKSGTEEKLHSASTVIKLTLTSKGSQDALLGLYAYEQKGATWNYKASSATAVNSRTAEVNVPGIYGLAVYDKTFSDVVSGHWAEQAIRVLASQGIVSGKPENKYDPSGNVTRAEFTAFLVRALKLESSEIDTTFTDVDTNAWYANDVAAAYQSGLIEGMSANIFGPNEKLTREQMVVLASRAYTFASEQAAEVTELNYKDAGEIAAWAAQAVGQMTKLGIIKGNLNGNFAPKSSANRAETAQLVYNLIDFLK